MLLLLLMAPGSQLLSVCDCYYVTCRLGLTCTRHQDNKHHTGQSPSYISPLPPGRQTLDLLFLTGLLSVASSKTNDGDGSSGSSLYNSWRRCTSSRCWASPCQETERSDQRHTPPEILLIMIVTEITINSQMASRMMMMMMI